MKKQIIAATLMASMVLAVGYSNGTNVKVTTHEGKVVEAKVAVYVKPENTSAYHDLPRIFGYNPYNSGAQILFGRCKNMKMSNFTNSLKQNVYSFKKSGSASPDLQVKTYYDKHGDEEVESYTVYSPDIDMDFGNMIGSSFTGVSSSIPYGAQIRNDNYLKYECERGTIEFSGSNGRVTSITVTFDKY